MGGRKSILIEARGEGNGRTRKGDNMCVMPMIATNSEFWVQ